MWCRCGRLSPGRCSSRSGRSGCPSPLWLISRPVRGIGTGQAWAWPLIVVGTIVVATVAIVALAGQKAAWHPWALLNDGAVVPVTANALTWAQDSNKARTETGDDSKGSSLVCGVDLTGFEPVTFSLRTRRATNCAIGP